jgi:hypothetical protein
MIENELFRPRRHKKRRVFQYRERRPRKGEMLQMYGSPHDWFDVRCHEYETALKKYFINNFEPFTPIQDHMTIHKDPNGWKDAVVEAAMKETVLFLCWPPMEISEQNFGYEVVSLFLETALANNKKARIIYISEECTGDEMLHQLLIAKFKEIDVRKNSRTGVLDIKPGLKSQIEFYCSK